MFILFKIGIHATPTLYYCSKVLQTLFQSRRREKKDKVIKLSHENGHMINSFFFYYHVAKISFEAMEELG